MRNKALIKFPYGLDLASSYTGSGSLILSFGQRDLISGNFKIARFSYPEIRLIENTGFTDDEIVRFYRLAEIFGPGLFTYYKEI